MRIRRLIVLGLGGAFALGCGETPLPLEPQGPEASLSAIGALVTGSGHVASAAGLREFTFHAVETPQGAVTGSYKVVLPNGLFFEADVTCMAVEGSTGWVAGTIRATNAAPVVIGSGSMFYAIDGGEGEGAQDVVSVAAFNAAEGADVAFCEERPLELAPLQVSDGNVEVR